MLIGYYSLFMQTLCAWSAKEHNLLQLITVKFPFSHREQEYDHRPLFILPPSILTVSCNEYIGKYELGKSHSEMDFITNEYDSTITSHTKPLTAAVYDSYYEQVPPYSTFFSRAVYFTN